jgi:signal transduction histidine kinase
VSAPGPASFERTRRGAAEALAVALLVVGFAAYVPSVSRAVSEGLWSVAAIDTAALAVVLFIVVSRRRMPYEALSALLVVIVWLLGAGLLALLGANGSGHQWMAGGCALAGLLTGPRATSAALAAMLGWSVVAALAFGPGGAIGGPPPLAPWWVYTANSFAIALGVAVPTLFVVRGLRRATASAERQAAELEAERGALQRALDALRAETAERLAVEERLRQSERLGALGTLAGGIAHDVNNLLTPILLSTSELRATETDPERRDLLSLAESAALSGRDLIARIVAFASPSAEPGPPVPATPLLRDATRLLRASLLPEIEVASQIAPDLGPIALAPSELHRVLLNLGTNARHAGAGALRIVAFAGEGADAGHIVVEVADDGAGMASDIASRAFDPYFTTRRGSGGSGLGLATVHAAIAAVGGAAELRSAPGEGTTVRIAVPIAPAR